jgi:magnesium and cobalt transporter
MYVKYMPKKSLDKKASQKSNFNIQNWFKRLINYVFSYNKLEDTVKEIIEYRRPERKKMTIAEQAILHNFLEFGEKTADDVMIPRSDICALKITDSFEDIVHAVIQKAHTRMPVYKDNMDQILGFINIKDVIALWGSKNNQITLEKIMRKVLVVVPKMKLLDLLTEMQSKHTHIAIVIDEHGGTDGMVTIEDIVEELVGEIEDEHDRIVKIENYYIIDENNIICNARMEIGKVEEIIKLPLNQEEESDFDTIGGLILSKTGTIPKTGEKVDITNLVQAEILEANLRSIKKVRLSYKKE